MSDPNSNAVEPEPIFDFEGIFAVIVLVAVAGLIVLKWPMAGFTIALTPVLGGPVGIGLYVGIFWLTRRLIEMLLSPFKHKAQT